MPSRLRKALILSMLPEGMGYVERFRLAAEVGFEGIESPPIASSEERRRLRAASEAVGLPIHSIIYGGWHAPLSSGDPGVVERGLADLRAAMECAKELGADTVLLVPAIVNESTRYADAYTRSQQNIRKLLPLAEKLRVVIAVENVWNNFLLSPLEFARYIDEFRSPYVKAYFDVGNVLAYGWSEDWIRTLGKRIHRVHLKDFKRGPRQFVNLLEGDVNWREVRRALDEVGYSGFLTAELGGGDREYLRDLAQRIERIIAGV
ncbi:MAG: sugar phosphate isomerase/epimerase family protein [Armatimonadota bacterium]|nr:sugar phosphate isomerase/epimerase [bacterium]MDW8103410.1 sugar phosphate isomerase/epimerase family protein [Armatimonadota bacterium]MDW8290470.1 sugar phosphate isomerase/epimerase family protein [Armatimonadota bacterium]